eukprot:8925796-Lingulodinium_polyedra.AAC.1
MSPSARGRPACGSPLVRSPGTGKWDGVASMPDMYESVLLLLATPSISAPHVLPRLLPSVLQ